MAPRREAASKFGPLGGEFRGVSAAGAYTPDLFWQAFKGSLAKFDPRVQIRNPVMFVVWVGTLVTLALTIQPDLFGPTSASHLYNGVVTIILALTVWFANFAEALAEGRGKAKATALRQTRLNLVARRILENGREETVPATQLRIGDIVRVEQNDLLPADGTVVEGIAYVNESAITGESAPVLKEAGTAAVTAGTKIVSDWLLIRVTANAGDSFLDRMIRLVEGAKRQKTPNEIALTVLLSILTLIFLIVVAAIAPVAVYLNARINVWTSPAASTALPEVANTLKRIVRSIAAIPIAERSAPIVVGISATRSATRSATLIRALR